MQEPIEVLTPYQPIDLETFIFYLNETKVWFDVPIIELTENGLILKEGYSDVEAEENT